MASCGESTDAALDLIEVIKMDQRILNQFRSPVSARSSRRGQMEPQSEFLFSRTSVRSSKSVGLGSDNDEFLFAVYLSNEGFHFPDL